MRGALRVCKGGRGGVKKVLERVRARGILTVVSGAC